jgi:hypothetical protein
MVSGMGFAAPSRLTVRCWAIAQARRLVQLGLHVHSIADEHGAAR